jgi:hypothetical protein
VKHVTLARSILRFYTEYLCWPDISLHDRQWTVILPLDLSSALEPPRSMSSLTRYSFTLSLMPLLAYPGFRKGLILTLCLVWFLSDIKEIRPLYLILW